MTTTRRRFLTSTLGTAAGLAVATSTPTHASLRPEPAATPPTPDQRAKNIIFMVSDGMSAGTFALAEQVHQLRHARSTHWLELLAWSNVRRALQETSASDALVTDSAAAASAWGTGLKTPSSAVNLHPDGRQPQPIFQTLRNARKRTGLVTTTTVTHATPAGFIANVPDRNMERAIAAQILERRVDVVLGGGAANFPTELLATRPDLRVVRDAAALAAAAADKSNPDPVLGLFAPGHCPFELDRAAGTPSLADMTRDALSLLEAAPEGFALQVEGGRIDHAAHSNDAGALIADQLAFDAALGVVVHWIRQRDDTLLIVTTDHGNASPGLTAYGEAGRRGLELAASAKKSFEWLFHRAGELERDGIKDALRQATAEATGISLDADELARALPGPRPTHPYLDQASKITSLLGAVLTNHNAIAFASPNHTAEFVETTAWGPGSQRLAPFIPNTALYALVLAALGVPAA